MIKNKKSVMEMCGISRKSSPLNHEPKIDGKHVPHLKDNVGKINENDVIINAYPGYRKRNVGTDKETTSQEEFDMNEDFPRIDKFTGKTIKKNKNEQ